MRSVVKVHEIVVFSSTALLKQVSWVVYEGISQSSIKVRLGFASLLWPSREFSRLPRSKRYLYCRSESGGL